MIVFSHIPKTAGTSLKSNLRSHFGINHIDSLKTQSYPYTMEDFHFAQKVFRNPKAITGHNLVDPVGNLPLPGAKYITVLREPISRCASHYQDMRLRTKGDNLPSFKEWISMAENQNLSVNTIAGSSDLKKAKLYLKEKFLFVGFTEQFERSIKLLKILTGEPILLLNNRLITASNNKIKKELLADPDSMLLLKKHNKLDVELYLYALEEVFEPMLEKYADQIDQQELYSSDSQALLNRRMKNSIRFNKFVYRQAIKVFK